LADRVKDGSKQTSAFDAPLGRSVGKWPWCLVWRTRMVWHCGYLMLKKFWRYIYSFWQNSQTWQTDRQTDKH